MELGLADNEYWLLSSAQANMWHAVFGGLLICGQFKKALVLRICRQVTDSVCENEISANGHYSFVLSSGKIEGGTQHRQNE